MVQLALGLCGVGSLGPTGLQTYYAAVPWDRTGVHPRATLLLCNSSLTAPVLLLSSIAGPAEGLAMAYA